MVLRRQLSPDLDRIRLLIDGARHDFADYGTNDLPAQLALLEGLFERQLFQIGTAKSLLKEAYTGVCALDPPYLFLHPDQIEALLVQACLCSPFDRLYAEIRSQEILRRADSGRWSQAVASSVLLQMHLDDTISQTFASEPGVDSIVSPLGCPEDREMLQTLETAARLENDPFLLTEYQIQRLGRFSVVRASDMILRSIEELMVLLSRCPAPLTLLRAVEASLLWELCGGLGASATIRDIRQMGYEVLDALSLRLPAYSVPQKLRDTWADSLAVSSYSTATIFHRWNSTEMHRLRALAWP